MTFITRFSLIVALTLACSLVCVAQEQSKEAANASTTANSSTTENAVGPINGEGTTGKIPKFTGTNEIGDSIITESSSRVGISTPVAPQAKLHVHVPVLPSQTGNGTNATPLLQTSGGKGGNTTGADAGFQTAGKGADILLTAGQGGDAAANNTRGVGGSITLQPGAPGGGAGFGGAHGNVLLAPTSGNVLLAPTGFGRVGIGISSVSLGKLQVQSGIDDAIYARSLKDSGVIGIGHVDGVRGSSTIGNGVNGFSTDGNAVYGNSVNGNAGLFDGKVQVNGNLTVDGNVCADNVPCPSDARLKQGITNLSYGLTHLLRLRPVSWHWKTEPQGKLQLGLVAQEVEPVMPELILRGTDATKPLGLNYMALLPVMVKAIQEQQSSLESKEAEIKALRAENTAIRTENEAIKARLDALEQALRELPANAQP